MENLTRAPRYKQEPEKKPILVGSSNEVESFFKSPYWDLSYHFPWNPDPLAAGNSYTIYDEMHFDDQVKSALAIKKDMVVNTGWQVLGENPEVNDFITKTLENINEQADYNYSFDDILRDMLSAYGYGFSLSEPVHTIKDGKLIYKSIRTRPPHSFRFNVDDYGTILSITQATNKGDLTFKPSMFLHYIYQMEFGNPYGRSDLSASFNAWKAKKYFTRFFAVYVEKYASPPLVGKFPKTYSAQEISDFHETMKSNQNATTFAIPDDVMIEFVQSSRDASDVYLKGLDYYNMQIARSILVPDLLGLGGTETGGGSYALGKEQFKVFLSTIKKDRESLERKITMKLVRPLVLANYGDISCWFQFKPYTFDDVKEYLDLWIKAVTGKVFKANEDEINYFRQATGFPEGEVEIPKSAPAPTFGGNPNGMPPVNNDNGKSPKSKEDEERAKEEKEKEEKKFAYRDLTEYEEKMNFAQIEKTLDKQEDKTLRQVKAITRKIYLDLIKQVREKGLLKTLKPKSLENLKPKYQKEFKTILKRSYEDFYKDTYNQEQKDAFPNEKERFAIELVPEEFLTLLDIDAFKTVGDYSFEVTKQAKNIVMQGIKDGYGAGEITSILHEELKATTETWATTAVRTKTNEIYNEARKDYWENDENAKEILVGYEWSSILDDRTSDVCISLDKKQITIQESQWLKPPAHFNCRSQLVQITKFETPPKFSKPNQDKLVKMGGGLLKPGGKKKKSFQLEDKPTMKNANMINLFGETVIIASAGMGKHVVILSIIASNIDTDKPVIVGFRGQKEAEVKYKTLLNYNGGLIQKEFEEIPWTLDEDSGFMIDMSAPVNVEYTIEYIITDAMGMRVM